MSLEQFYREVRINRRKIPGFIVASAARTPEVVPMPESKPTDILPEFASTQGIRIRQAGEIIIKTPSQSLSFQPNTEAIAEMLMLIAQERRGSELVNKSIDYLTKNPLVINVIRGEVFRRNAIGRFDPPNDSPYGLPQISITSGLIRGIYDYELRSDSGVHTFAHELRHVVDYIDSPETLTRADQIRKTQGFSSLGIGALVGYIIRQQMLKRGIERRGFIIGTTAVFSATLGMMVCETANSLNHIDGNHHDSSYEGTDNQLAKNPELFNATFRAFDFKEVTT